MQDHLKIIGAHGNRRSLDFYPTPSEVTQTIVDFMLSRCLLLRGDTVWEPACGDMAMVDVLEKNGLKTIATDITLGTDFLTAQEPNARWIITNPPFSMAEQFIRHAHDLNKPFAFLLKSQYWHSAKRKPLFDEITPAYVLPLTWRPDFTGQGNSLMDMIWVVWNGETKITQYIPLAKPKK